MDRWIPVDMGHHSSVSNFGKFTLQMGWINRYGWLNPEGRTFSCFSSTTNTISRVNVVLTNKMSMPYILKMIYNSRNLSDHCSLLLILHSVIT